MRQERRFVVDILFVLALFCVFTVSALVIVSIGADVYQHTVQDMGTNYDTRTSIAYITEKVRHADSLLGDQSVVYIDELEGIPALCLEEEQNDALYCTYLYYYEGYLRELYIRKSGNIGSDVASAGQKILELDALSFTMLSDNLLKVTTQTTDGRLHSINLSLRCTP